MNVEARRPGCFDKTSRAATHFEHPFSSTQPRQGDLMLPAEGHIVRLIPLQLLVKAGGAGDFVGFEKKEPGGFAAIEVNRFQIPELSFHIDRQFLLPALRQLTNGNRLQQGDFGGLGQRADDFHQRFGMHPNGVTEHGCACVL